MEEINNMANVYERDGDNVRMYEDCGTVDKTGRINELQANMVANSAQITALEDENTAIQAEITALNEM